MFLETLSNIPARRQKWVWNGVIPEGQVTLLVGEPGVGKSMFAMDAIARLTRGQRGLSVVGTDKPGSVILFSGEDDLASVVRTRLDSAGADDQFVEVVTTDSDPMSESCEYERCRLHGDEDFSALESYLIGLHETGVPCRLIVIDPANCFLDSTDGRNDAKAREMMARLGDLAMRYSTAILLVAKPSKSERGKRGRWSKTTPVLAEVARSVWTIVKDPDVPGRRLLLPVKTNLCEMPPGLSFTIRDQRICWDEESVALTAEQFEDETTQHQRLQHRAAESELTRATGWLRVRLRDGQVYSKDLITDAVDNDFSERTLRRALVLLDCRKGKEKKTDGQWHWRLPGLLGADHGQVQEDRPGVSEGPKAESDRSTEATTSDAEVLSQATALEPIQEATQGLSERPQAGSDRTTEGLTPDAGKRNQAPARERDVVDRPRPRLLSLAELVAAKTL